MKNQSQFSLGGGNGGYEEQEDSRYPRRGGGQATANQNNNIPWGSEESKDDPRFPRKKENTGYGQQEGEVDTFGRPLAGPGSFTSVKYSGNPPGGKSSGPLW